MNTGAAFVANRQTAEAMEPGQGTFNDPARAAEPAPIGGAALRQQGGDAPSRQFIAMRLRIIAAVPLNQSRFPYGPADTPAHRWHRVNQGQQLRDVVPIGRCQRRDERNPVRVGENMMLRPGFAAIGRVRSSFFPPRTARMEELSAMARARSSWPRWRNSASRTACRRFHTPARCQRTRRRQHVLPDPHPIAFGSICQGRPLRSTNRIPVKAARSGTRGRPIALNRRRGGLGKSGSMRLHNASSIKRWAMRDRLAAGHATVPSWPRKYKIHVSYF